jgi:hypothetical protein
MSKLKLDVESLVVVTFVTNIPPAPVVFAAVPEMTDCTCKPYFCLSWPTS